MMLEGIPEVYAKAYSILEGDFRLCSCFALCYCYDAQVLLGALQWTRGRLDVGGDAKSQKIPFLLFMILFLKLLLTYIRGRADYHQLRQSPVVLYLTRDRTRLIRTAAGDRHIA